MKIYLSAVDSYVRWLESNGYPLTIDRRLVQAWVAEALANGAATATAAARLAGVRQFSKWLAREGEIPSDPLLGVVAPKGDIPLTPVLSEDQLKALFRACDGERLRDRRDEVWCGYWLNAGCARVSC